MDTAAIDKEVSNINGSAPDGEPRRLRGVELTARGLDGFSVVTPSIAKCVQLPQFAHSDRMAWPLPKPSLAAMVAMAMMPAHDSRHSSEWHEAAEDDNRRRAQNEAMWDEQEAARQAESKRQYEQSLPR